MQAGHASPILCCAHSPTGKYAATGSGDATCRIWDMEIETPKWTLSGHKGWVLCVEWDSREKMLATGGHDGQVSSRSGPGSEEKTDPSGPIMVTSDRSRPWSASVGTYQMDHLTRFRTSPPPVCQESLPTARVFQ